MIWPDTMTIEQRSNVDEVAARVAQSRRYRHVAPSVMRRLAREELDVVRGDVDDAVKRTKRRLHQAVGACLPAAPAYSRILEQLDRAASHGDEAIRKVLEQTMALHASSRERLPYLARFYDEIFSRAGQVSSVLDAACGLNPLARPWMRLTEGAVYHGFDIDLAMLEFCREALRRLGAASDLFGADLLDLPALPEVDLALLLKVVNTIEQQRRGLAWDLIERIRARVVVVTFPTQSLGGRSKGMARTYAESFEREAARRAFRYERCVLPSELAYLVYR